MFKQIIPQFNQTTRQVKATSQRFLQQVTNSSRELKLRSGPVLRRLKRVRHHPKFWLGIGLGAGIGSSAIALSLGIYQLESSLPKSAKDVLTYGREGTLTIKSADGTVLQEIGPVSHDKLKIWQFPDLLIKAFIASEDRRFQEHRGVDFQGITRAFFSNLQAGEVIEGGSTITQQLARIVYLNQERSLGRKFKEMRLAQQIEQELDKGEILEPYLNLVYLGSGAYGVTDAAWVYFSKPVEQLTLAEAATLAGIVPAPSLYSPLENPKAAKERRDLVLQKMAVEGFITQQEAKAAIASPVVTHPSQPKRLQRLAPYFTDYIQRELPKYVSSEALKTGGITVETTLNAKWQETAEAAIKTAVERYGRWQAFKQAALVSVDPRSGQIRAMVGGDDFDKNQFNRVTQAKRQPGSTFKTFVYTTAIAAGFSPYRSFMDAEYVVDGYKPENYGDKYSGSYLSMPQALASSVNVVAVQVLIKVGWNPIIKMAHKMGIESELQSTYSLALGASEVNLLELTSAYGTLANQGIYQKPYGISRILDRKGNVLYTAKSQAQEALDPETSSIMTWMLRGVVTSGTGQAAQIGRPVAGKTGTSDKARDLWFVGYIPQLVTGVWLGNDNNQPTWGASSTAAVVWRQFMLEASQAMPIESFDSPKQLEGRKGTLKAEPIKIRRSYYTIPKTETASRQEQVNPSEGTSQTTYRRRRRRSRVSYQQPEQTRSNRVRQQVTPAVTAVPSSASASVTSQPSNPAPPPSAPASIPVPAPESVPPAPPAARKEG